MKRYAGETDFKKESDIESLQKIENYSSIIRPGKLNPNNPITNTLWVRSIVEATRLTTLYNLYKTTFFILYNLAVNIFSTIGNFESYLPDSLMISVLSLSSVCTAFSNALSKFKEVGKAVDALHLTAEQETFYYNLLHKLEEVLIFEGKHALCLTRESDHIPKKTKAILELLQEHYTKSTGFELEIRDSTEIARYCQEYQSENPEAKIKITIISNCDLHKAELPRGTRVLRVYDHGWLARLQHSFTHAPITQGIPTAIKASLALVRWNLTIGIQSALSMITGIHAAFGIFYAFTTKETSGPIIRAEMLAFAIAISYAKTIVNKDLKQHLTDRVTRITIESIWHGQRFSIDYKNTLLSLIPGIISLLFVTTTSFFYAEKGPLTLCEEVDAITGINIPLNQTFLFYFSMASIITGVISTYATGVLPVYQGLCKGLGCKDSQTEATIQTYPNTARAFGFTTWVDSLFFGGNARFNVIKTIEILQQKYPDFLPFLYLTIPREVTAATVGACVAAQAIYWCYYTGMDKFTANMKVYEKIKALFKENWARVSFSQKENNLSEPLIQEERTSPLLGPSIPPTRLYSGDPATLFQKKTYKPSDNTEEGDLNSTWTSTNPLS